MTLSNLSDRGTLRGTLQRNSGNYNDLINKPAINGHTLIGNQSGHALGLANEDDIIYVEANPLGPATADLHKILVDDTIYSIPDVVVYGKSSGNIASFDDGGDNKPLKSLKVAINPQQASGTPTPDNPLPISGWTGAEIGRTGKNLAPINTIEAPKTTVTSIFTGQNHPVSDYVITFDLVNATFQNSSAAVLDLYDNNGVNFAYPTPTRIRRVSDNAQMSTLSQPISGRFYYKITNHSLRRFAIQFRSDAYCQWTGAMKNIQLEVGTEVTNFEPYNGTTNPITWSEAGEVFGGTLDVTNGKLKARPYYASYNGETLIGPWISSMDVYDPNTPPTTGAQVVDLGGVETEIDISPTQIRTLLGNNNIWSDTGEILECVYQRDLNIALNKALSQ